MLIKVDWNSKKSLKEAVAPKLNDNFWKWFGNSKCVDEQGKPLVVYHGTDAGKFDIFNMSDKWLKGIKCVYFSSDYDTAASYCMSGYPSSFYLKIENPYILDANYSKYDSPEKCVEKALENAYKGGYDGAIVLNIKDDAYQEYEEGVDYPYSTTYIVFNPNQIKSVDNNGEWSLTSDNINEWWSGGVNWQNDREGLGGVGATMDCHLFFFMFPDQFLNLCPKFSYGDDEFFNQYVSDRKPIGIPFLWCEVDEKNKTLKVLDHEGRHRVKAIRDYANSNAKSQPDIPVAIIYNKDKYRLPVDLIELRKNWKIVGQKGDRTYNVGQFRVQNNLDNARIGLDNLYESIESAYMDKNGNMFEIHKNPSDKELKDLLKISKGKALRVILAKNGDFYVADAYGYDHDSMEDELKIGGYRGWYDENGFSVVDNGLDYFDDNIIEGVINVLKKYYQKFGKEVFDNFVKTIKFHKQNNPEYYKKFIITNPLIKDLLNNKLTESSEPNLNDNFWNRFKDSKPVDVNVYHGSPNVFKKFDKRKLGTSTKKFENGKYSSTNYGFFFTNDKEYASGYGENNYKCNIKLNNPLVVDMSDYIATEEVLSKFLQQAKNENKDGVIFKNIREVGRNPSTEYVVFNSDNIKILNKLTESSESNLNQNFWKWFKGSKTVDEQGNPLIFYHGTKQPNITNFKAKYSDGLVFFAYNEEFAKEWASNAPLTPEQEQGVSDFKSSDDLANYRKEVAARYKRDYGDNWADDDDIRKAAKWEIKEYEKQKYKQMGIEENVIPVYIKATKIFNPEKDYMKVIKEISDHWDLDLKADYKQEYNEAKAEYDKVNNVINKWFEEHKEYRNDSAMEPEFRKREDVLTNALNKFNEVKKKIETRNNHLKRIMSGAWVYFENPETINKIWELGYDAIELSEHSGVITTLAVREGTNQVKSIFNYGEWGSSTNIFETKILDEMSAFYVDKQRNWQYREDFNKNRNGGYFKILKPASFNKAKEMIRINMFEPELITSHKNPRGIKNMNLKPEDIKAIINFLNAPNCIVQFYKSITNWQGLIMIYNKKKFNMSYLETYKTTEKNKKDPQVLGIDRKIPPYEELINFK